LSHPTVIVPEQRQRAILAEFMPDPALVRMTEKPEKAVSHAEIASRFRDGIAAPTPAFMRVRRPPTKL
jgi:hypothetical protein